MASALNSGSNGPDSNPREGGHCVVLQRLFPPPPPPQDVLMATGELLGKSNKMLASGWGED